MRTKGGLVWSPVVLLRLIPLWRIFLYQWIHIASGFVNTRGISLLPGGSLIPLPLIRRVLLLKRIQMARPFVYIVFLSHRVSHNLLSFFSH